QYAAWNSGSAEEETDQLKLLEDKVEGLIETIMTLKGDKDALKEKLDIQDEKISDLSQQVENLKTVKDMAKKRIVSLLEKIELVEK
ncbi:MAG TPA: cell division protein ZapB, partial [Deltaproteobacteria bacterium]|nr:cell division protein ZapB [Deltaproteobacteria bacterium]